ELNKKIEDLETEIVSLKAKIKVLEEEIEELKATIVRLEKELEEKKMAFWFLFLLVGLGTMAGM
ncbi:coiled-coil domain-containing protein 22, partial [bacterium]|nr:coiled-coil domain-containing protein 22 [bacterium]